MALVALQNSMPAGQGEAHQVVIECGILPPRCVMTTLANRREICRHVIRVRGALEIRHVAAVAGRRRSQVVENPALLWLGPVVFWKSWAWQE